MKSCHVGMAARALVERQQLVWLRDTGTIDVLINGKYQGDEMKVSVRPVVVAELDRRIAEIDADLATWGVELPIDGR